MRGRGLVLLPLLLLVVLTSCGPVGKGVSPAADVPGAQTEAASQNGPYTTLVSDFRNADLGCGWEPTGSMELRYARCFTVDYFEGGYALACMADGNRYLIASSGTTGVFVGKENQVVERTAGAWVYSGLPATGQQLVVAQLLLQ
jgi:iron complex transport system substrate-binding protein